MIFILPTDTCYGLAGSLTKEDHEAIYRLKGRDFTKQLALLIRSYDEMQKYIQISEDQIQFLKNYPYPWSFLGKRNTEFILPSFLDLNQYAMISLRVAENCIDANIRDTIQYPLFLTSANVSGQPESSTLEATKIIFPEISGFDGGLCDKKPSDIFSLDSDKNIIYLRKNYGEM